MNSAAERWLSRITGRPSWPGQQAERTELTHGFWVMADQAVVSLANFFTTVLIGRLCLPAELGLYAMGFSLAVFLCGIPKALVWSPYTAFAPHVTDQDRATYTGSSTLMLVAIAVTTAIGLLVSGLATSLFVSESRLAMLLFVLSPFVALMMFREHVRRLCLAWLSVGEVLVLDTTVAVIQVAGLLALAWWGVLSGVTAYGAAGLAASGAIVWLLLRRATMRFDWSLFKAHLQKNWRFSRWLLAGALAALASQLIYRWGLDIVRNRAEVGLLAAAQSVILFANPILLGMSNYCGPATANSYARDGRESLFRITVRSSGVLLAFVVVFFAAIVFWGSAVLAAMFGPEYANQGALVIAIALGLLSEAMLIPTELALMALDRSRFLFKTALFRLGVTLSLGILLMVWFGAAGVGYAMLGINLVTLAWEWHVLRRLSRDA